MDEGLEDLYAWVDTVPLTRPKKAFNRDFADGGVYAGRVLIDVDVTCQ